jgi:hypothetical protein
MTILHFAQLDQRDNVIAVLAVNKSDVNNTDYPESEREGIAYLTRIVGNGVYRQTDPDGAYRRRFAGPGMSFDVGRNAFIEPQPFPSWSLNDNDDWVAPKPKPDDPTRYWIWDEAQQEWIGYDKPLQPPIETIGE